MSLATAVRAGMALMLLLVAWPVAHAAEGTPTDILKGIYREAVKGTASDWLEPRRRGGFLSASLLAEWAKLDAKKAPENDVGPIDFDLTTDTNALELEGFEIKVKREGRSAAVLSVTLNYRKPYSRPRAPSVVTYDFIREDGRWRIDNFRTRTWSVRDLLTQWQKES